MRASQSAPTETVTATFSNGEKENVGQIALANVRQPPGAEIGRRSGLPDNPGERNGRGGRRGKLGVGQIQDSSLGDGVTSVAVITSALASTLLCVLY